MRELDNFNSAGGRGQSRSGNVCPQIERYCGAVVVLFMTIVARTIVVMTIVVMAIVRLDDWLKRALCLVTSWRLE